MGIRPAFVRQMMSFLPSHSTFEPGFELCKSARQFLVRRKHLAQLHEGAHDPDVDGDRAVAFEHGRQHGDSLLCESVGSVATAAALGFEVTDCDLKAAHSAALSCIMKSAGKRLRLRLTACSNTLGATPYRAANSASSSTRWPRRTRMARAICSVAMFLAIGTTCAGVTNQCDGTARHHLLLATLEVKQESCSRLARGRTSSA